MPNWIIVSFYTLGTGYEDEARKMEKSLVDLRLPYHLFPVESRGSWRENANYKSEVILMAFDTFPDKDIVFIDSDEVVLEYPALFDELSGGGEYDIAVVRWPRLIHKNELDAATIWLKNNDVAYSIVSLWDAMAKEAMDIRHQKSLDAAIQKKKANGGIRVYHLPLSYARAVGRIVSDSSPAIIEHHQASLRLQEGVDNP